MRGAAGASPGWGLLSSVKAAWEAVQAGRELGRGDVAGHRRASVDKGCALMSVVLGELQRPLVSALDEVTIQVCRSYFGACTA